MGTYGMIRFCLPLFPEASHRAAPYVAVLAIIGIIYGALVAMVQPNLKTKSTVKCDALLVDTVSRSDTYPYVDIREDDVEMGHEASVSKISEDQLFYLMSRGMTKDEAAATVVRGFVEPIARELPMEYALELNRLIELQMQGAVGDGGPPGSPPPASADCRAIRCCPSAR